MNTSKAFLLGAALLAAAGTFVAPAQTAVRVTADNVNLRAKALLTSEVVAQANYNDQLVAREIGEEWIEVAAPASVDLWVMKQYVQQPQNTIGANRVNLRAGPSINYNIVHTLALGDPVEVRGEEIQDWLKVAPPAGTHVWVHRDFVEILSGDAPAAKTAEKSTEIAKNDEKSVENAEISEKTAENPADEPKNDEKQAKKRKSKAKTEKTEPATAETAVGVDPDLPTPIVSPSVPEKDAAVREIPVPPPANLKLIPLEGQGRLTEVEGELRAAPLINEAPTRYRVVRWQNNRWQILCHVYGEAAKLRSLQDKRVRVKGREYWIQGAAAPVLVPDQIQEITGGGEPAPETPADPFVH